MIQKETVHCLVDQLFEIGKTLQGKAIPQEAKQHFQKAKREGLLGLQSLIAYKIQEIDNEEKQNQQATQGKKITIEE